MAAADTELVLLLEELHGARQPGQLQRVMALLGAGRATAKEPGAVRIGVLGASQVATYALIWPARRRSDVVVAAVAARDGQRAAQFARRHGIAQAYGSYQELLDDPTLDAIYVATPNGLHGCWAKAALTAGKHVLCEKPFTANAAEARDVQDAAAKHKLLCREAFHYKEHPANKAVARMLQGGSIGQVKELTAQVLIPAWLFSDRDIRFQAKLAGGTAMDAGCYAAHALRFFPGCSRPKVVHAAASKLLDGGQIDGRMVASLSYPSAGGCLGAGAVGRMEADLRHGGLWPSTRFVATGTRGRVQIDNFIMPVVGHTISLTRTLDDASSPSRRGDALGDGLREEQAQLYVYGSGESNYSYQLDRFITDLHVLRDPRAPKAAKRAVQQAMRDDAADAVDNMRLIDAIYAAAGLPARQPTAAFVRRGSREAAALLPRGGGA